MDRIDALLQAMTLPEKLGQLTMSAAGHTITGPFIAGASIDDIRAGTIGSLLNLTGREQLQAMQREAVEHSRLGIPLLFGLDVIHGYRTLFPVPLAETGAFDPALWEGTAREAAREACADGIAMTFAPMLDVARDPRWGRGIEGPGEDPLVGVRLAQAKIRGFQGMDLADAEAVAAVAKHYLGYGAVTAGREYATVDLSERTVHEVHLPPFAAAVAAGVAAIMPAFHDLAGIPMTAHRPLLQGMLRDRLGFNGVIVSDYNAIGELVRHGVAADLPQAAALALQAGVDIDMMAGAYRHGLPEALARGWVGREQIDAAVRRVLQLKERLGLFSDPYRRGARAETPSRLAERRALARAAAVRSLVLLRNAHGVLPLRTPHTLAVLGPLADAAAEMRGPWHAIAQPGDCVSVLAGLSTAWPDARLLHEPGVAIDAGTAGAANSVDSALAACDEADAIVLCLGEAASMSGEAASRANPILPGAQRAFAAAVLARARQHGRPVVLVLFSGRPLVEPELLEGADAVLAAWFPGAEAGHGIADVISGRASPSGRTAVSWPRAVGQIPLSYGERPAGRPADPADPYTSRYLDVPNEPLFVFGHGLTYGHCALSALRVSPPRVRASDTIRISLELHNSGERACEETLFLFARDRLASVARPVLELKDFQRAAVQAGERRTLQWELPATALRFLGPDLTCVFEPGEVELLVGFDARRSGMLVATVELVA